jgi:copper resistance protein C
MRLGAQASFRLLSIIGTEITKEPEQVKSSKEHVIETGRRRVMQSQREIVIPPTERKNKLRTALGRLALISAWTTVFVLAAPGSALAHARLVRSTPKLDGEVAKTPSKVELWFNELLDQGFNTISVYSATEAEAKERKNLVDGEARVDGKDRTHLSIAVDALPPGDYVVEWSVLSLDGHTARGKFKFKLRASQ